MQQKICGVLLLLCVLFSLTPAAADAAPAGGHIDWSVENGVLRISGSQIPIPDYSNPDSVPWSANRQMIHSVVVQEGITRVGDLAFRKCENLTRVTLPDSLTSIGDSAFAYCRSLTSVTIPDGVTSIGDNAFAYCHGLTSVDIPDSVTVISDNAFDNCPALTRVAMGNGVSVIGHSAFAYCHSLTSVDIPDSVTSIGDSAFDNCTALTRVAMGNGLTDIGHNAFAYCHSLTSVDIPDSVTSIGHYAFAYCSSLTRVTMGNNVTGIGAQAFNGCGSLSSVSIPDSVTSIEAQAFTNCAGLTRVTLGKNLNGIGELAFGGCDSLVNITVSPENIWFTSADGILFSKDGSVLVCYPNQYADVYTIPDGVTSIGDFAFYRCNRLTDVRISDSVTDIGNCAFMSCGRLAGVTLGDGLIRIGKNAFYSCDSLTGVTGGRNLMTIDEGAFSECGSLTGMTIPDGVVTLGRSVFALCPNLTSLRIPDSVTFMGSWIINGSNRLRDIYYSGSQEQWQKITIESEHLLEGVTIHYNSYVSVRPGTAPQIFTDVPANMPYAEAVAWCWDNGIMKGTTATEFSPDRTLSRGMVATVLYRRAGSPPVNEPDPFSDNIIDAYHDAAIWAASQGIVQGYGDGTFRPAALVNRQQLAIMLWRHAGKPEVPERIFADRAAISDGFHQAADWSVSVGAIVPKNINYFQPTALVPRSEIATALYACLA